MKIEFSKATFGAELEIGDVDTRIELPPGNRWCDKDGSIANSNGTANDPKKEFNVYGGEIQVKPANSPEELLKETMELLALFPKKDFNYTTNLHVHIRIPGLKDNLKALKQIAAYFRKHEAEMYELIEPMPFLPRTSDYNSKEAYDGALKRHKRRLRSHQYKVTSTVFQKMMKAQTPEDFYLAHAPMSQTGNPQWHLVVRAGVNLKQLFEDTETIEFRCFTMSDNPKRLLSAYKWVKLIMEAALYSGRSPKEILQRDKSLEFQPFFKYNYDMDRIFQMTNVYHNPRPKVAEAYRKLLENGVLKAEDLK